MIKANGKRISILIISVLALLICGAASVFAFKPATAEDAFDPATLEYKCRELSDTDDLEGAELVDGKLPTVNSYTVRMNTDFDSRNFELQTDWLYRIIPQEFFLNKCEYFHNGYGYSFYINTRMLSETYILSESDVVIIDNRAIFEEITASASIELSIAYSCKYVTQRSSVDGDVITYKTGAANCEPYLSDVKMFAGVVDEASDSERNSPTYGTGAVLRQITAEYSGLHSGDRAALQPTDTSSVKYSVGEMPYVENMYKKYASLKSTWTWGSLGGDCYETKTVDVANGKSKSVDLYTRDAQLSAYEGYFRFAAVEPDKEELFVNDHARMTVRLDDYAPNMRVYIGMTYDLFIKCGDERSLYFFADGEKFIVPDYGSFDKGDKDRFTPIGGVFEKTMWGEKFTIGESRKSVYFLTKNSVREIEFVPEKPGDYNIIVDDGFDVSIGMYGKIYHSNKIYNAEIGEVYTILVKSKRAGVSCNMKVDFAPPHITLNEAKNDRIAPGENVYYMFTPDKSGVYSFVLTGSDVELKVGVYGATSLPAIPSGVKSIDEKLEEGGRRLITVHNTGNAPQDISVTVKLCQALNLGEPITVTVDKTKYIEFTAPYNGNYKFNLTYDNNVRATVRDEQGGTFASFTEQTYNTFLKAGKYYIILDCFCLNLAVGVVIKYAPQELNGKQVAVSNINDYNVVKFVPNVTARYKFTLDFDPDAEISVYDGSGANVTSGVLTEEQSYYIKVHSENVWAANLIVDFVVDGVLNHNEYYTVKSGYTTVKFTPPVSGRYSLEGAENVSIFNDRLVVVYRNDELKKDGVYYIVFSSVDGVERIKIYLDPPRIYNGSGIGSNKSEYLTVEISERAVCDFTAVSWASKNFSFKLYDERLQLLYSSDEAKLSCELNAGRYYLFVYNPDNNYVLVKHALQYAV